MLTNIHPAEELISLARSRARDLKSRTVANRDVAGMVADGWSEAKPGKRTSRMTRAKAIGESLEDRVWTLLYRMGFDLMSGEGGAQVTVQDGAGAQSQIDVVAIDDDIALAIECKSSQTPSRRPQFSQELGRHVLLRERMTSSLRAQFPVGHKRPLVLAMFYQNVTLSDNDYTRAKAENVIVFREQELGYYEQLVSHIGSAAKYQLLADMIPGKSIPGLEIRVPAIRTKMGDLACYTFSITPEYLLKISYVSHRSKGRASDVNTYQRMLKKGRLKAIQQYIREDGIFPTNIVLNLDKNRLKFERSHQEGSDKENGLAGWLDIRAAYKSAWVIDGQHRLYAYSGLAEARIGKLCAVAFENLAPSQQAKMFIDINAKQKSVKQSLLMELVAELNWDSADEEIRAGAIISKAVQVLDSEPTSPLHQRILMANASKDEKRCISLTSLYSVLEKANLITRRVKNGLYEPGPLAASGNDATLERVIYVVERWLDTVKRATLDWWDKGSAPGGGIAMNDGIATCISILRSVFASLGEKSLLRLDNQDLSDVLQPYADALGQYLGSLTIQQRVAFRELRGVQGVTRRVRECQRAIREKMPRFNPEGLDRFIEEQKSQTNLRGKSIIDQIERVLQRVVLEELKRECGDEDSGWWTVGVPKVIRVRIRQAEEEDGGKRSKESYFNFIDYSKIAQQNWSVFSGILGRGKTGNKEAKLSWMNFVNEKRNLVAHASSGATLSFEDLDELEGIRNWLDQSVLSIKASSADITDESEHDDDNG